MGKSTNRIGHPVHRAQPGIRQCQSTEQAGQCHILPGIDIQAILAGFSQGAGGSDDTIPANGVCQRIGGDANERLDELCQRVQSRRGRDGGRQAVCQFGVNDCNARQHGRAAQADLDTFFRQGDDRIARHLGSGAGGGGNGNECG